MREMQHNDDWCEMIEDELINELESAGFGSVKQLLEAYKQVKMERNAAIKCFTDFTQAWWTEGTRFPCRWCANQMDDLRCLKYLDDTDRVCAGRFFEFRKIQHGMKKEDPLTLTELIDMPGKKIWVVPLQSKLAPYFDWEPQWVVYKLDGIYISSPKSESLVHILRNRYYGDSWIAYRREV